jgi:putative addiction module component (TIGR02574 family)
MSKAFEEVKDQALQLSREERLELASLLLDLDQQEANPEIEAAWEEEIRARVQAVEKGRVKGIPYEEVLERVNRRLQR